MADVDISFQVLEPTRLPISNCPLPWDYIPGVTRAQGQALARAEVAGLQATDRVISVVASNHNKVTGCASLVPLPWDSALFDISMARICALCAADLPTQSALLAALVGRAQDLGFAHIDLPIRVGDVSAMEAACALGWRVVACNLVLVWDLTRALPPLQARGVHVRAAAVEDEEVLGTLASLAIDPYSRFAADPYLPPGRVAALFRAWVLNSCRGRAEHVHVAELDGQVAGYCTWRMNTGFEAATGRKLATLELTAVHPDARKRGVLTALVDAGLRRLQQQGVDAAEVYTNVLNGGMQRGCTLLGAVTRSARYSLHWCAPEEISTAP